MNTLVRQNTKSRASKGLYSCAPLLTLTTASRILDILDKRSSIRCLLRQFSWQESCQLRSDCIFDCLECRWNSIIFYRFVSNSASSRDFVLITVSCLIQNVRASRSAFRKLLVESRKPSA